MTLDTNFLPFINMPALPSEPADSKITKLERLNLRPWNGYQV
ncbi:17614_t:CDS:2 [Cetraspora pellucida]|uniref:17614_t:CDS:1 n=1 Tax=Cetraspora pellucida TaxID=1433469 RepID=A0A9N9BC64_9GLOM|nr:17614_t:CDS:2 [Cetraspora pellucida]